MLRRLSKICKGGHTHQLVEGKSRTEASAMYPLPRLKSILQGMADTANAVSSLRETVEDEYNATLTLSLCPLVETDATHDQSAPSVTGASDSD